jgi:SAM-dependent methyltransferase
MTGLVEARQLRDGGKNGEALRAYAQLLERSQEPGLFTEAAEVALRVDAPTAEALARAGLHRAPGSALAAHHLAEALAAQGRYEESLPLFRTAVAADGRLADLRHRGAAPCAAASDRPCPTCATDEYTVRWVGNATRKQTVFGTMDPIKVWVECNGCHLVYTRTLPTDTQLGAYYAAQRGSPEGVATPDGRQVTVDGLAWEAVLERVERALPGQGRLLELGSGWGTFLACAAWRGWDATGLELSPPAAAHARRTFGVESHCASVPEGLPDETWDVIVAFEVIEHFPRPDVVLRALHDHLRPDGLLVLTTPDLDHPAHRVLGDSDPMWSVPGHLVWYDRRTLDDALRFAGFRPESRWFSARHVGSAGVVARRMAS